MGSEESVTSPAEGEEPNPDTGDSAPLAGAAAGAPPVLDPSAGPPSSAGPGHFDLDEYLNTQEARVREEVLGSRRPQVHQVVRIQHNEYQTRLDELRRKHEEYVRNFDDNDEDVDEDDVDFYSDLDSDDLELEGDLELSPEENVVTSGPVADVGRGSNVMEGSARVGLDVGDGSASVEQGGRVGVYFTRSPPLGSTATEEYANAGSISGRDLKPQELEVGELRPVILRTVKGDEGVKIRTKCAHFGCTNFAMPPTRFCHPHVLDDEKQDLYKPCTFVLNSGSARCGPIICGRPATSGLNPLHCRDHLRCFRVGISESLKGFGIEFSYLSTSLPRFGLLIAECVNQIQAKRRQTLKAGVDSISEKTKEAS